MDLLSFFHIHFLRKFQSFNFLSFFVFDFCVEGFFDLVFDGVFETFPAPPFETL